MFQANKAPLAAFAPSLGSRFRRLVASPAFQGWAARFPLTRRLVRRDGEALFDLVAGFCHSQILAAVIAFDLPDILMERPLSVRALASRCVVPEARMRVLLQGAAAIGLLRRHRDGRFGLARKGAALAGVPGLADMIRHHDVLYRDLADPVSFFRDGSETELASFWPYVFGGGMAPTDAARYSRLMTESQGLVADDTLRVVPLRDVRRICDVGGGSGAFLRAVAARYPSIEGILFDLPEVVATVALDAPFGTVAGSFRVDPLPADCDAISLVRVLYDHDDQSVAALLTACFAALPPGGRLIVSEPMSGGAWPSRAGDAYFALYTMAMRTGRARSAEEIATLCRAAGFVEIVTPKPTRPFVTSCLHARRPREVR